SMSVLRAEPGVHSLDTLAFTICSTPYGDMVAAMTEVGVCCLLSPGTGMGELHGWAADHAAGAALIPGKADDLGLQDQLDAYFSGTLREFDVPLDLRGTPFQLAVWQAVMRVPYGDTCSYADIARAVGRPGAWRAVGAANAVCPVCVIIPCHRVIGADG